jgi:hypothetical protein
MRYFIAFFVTKRASTRYKLPRSTCYALQHGSPKHEMLQLVASNHTSHRSSNIFSRLPEEPGPLLTNARQRLAMQLHPITDPNIRVQILAPIVQQMLQFAHRHYRALAWQPDTLVHIKISRSSAQFSQYALTIVIFASRKPEYHATWTISRST